jgi:hypothetical protein
VEANDPRAIFGRRRKNMPEFSFAGLTAHAKTVREARQKVESKLLEQVTGSYAPMLIRKDEYLCVIWREPQYGWVYRVLKLDEIGTGQETIRPLVFAGWDRVECERRARKHLAQYLYNDERTGEDVILDERDRKDHLSWVSWQRRYKAAIDQGKTDEEARLYASGRVQ